MKRHESLIPLSRFHRSCLFLALIAKENAPPVKGNPTAIDEKILYAKSFYQRQLKPHFALESKLWEYVESKTDSLLEIVRDLRQERIELIAQFESLTTDDAAAFYEMGALLEKHVRKEERVLFQQIQTDLSEEELLHIQSI